MTYWKLLNLHRANLLEITFRPQASTFINWGFLFPYFLDFLLHSNFFCYRILPELFRGGKVFYKYFMGKYHFSMLYFSFKWVVGWLYGSNIRENPVGPSWHVSPITRSRIKVKISRYNSELLFRGVSCELGPCWELWGRLAGPSTSQGSKPKQIWRRGGLLESRQQDRSLGW